jgi:uncharacterized protein YkwD
MNDVHGEDQTGVAPSHPTRTSSRLLGRSKRVLGGTAFALVTAAAMALPMQAPADAVLKPVSGVSSVAASVTGAKEGLAPAISAGSGMTRSVYEARLQTWANRVRHAHGIRPIAVRACHDRYAERWTGYLARNGQFRHQDLGRYMDACRLTKAGEILALGSVTPYQMIRMWLGSPDHRRILLDRSFGLTGIAARRDTNGNWIGCIDFGRR